MTVSDLGSLDLGGTVTQRGEPGYEESRTSGWNELVPDRYPDAIVTATSVDDVVAVVRRCREDGLALAVRTGGHHWFSTALRDGTVLLDLSALGGIEVDAENRTASVGPAVRAGDLLAALAPHGLAFPVGHCPDVPLAGFLLGGGLGLNWGKWKPACFSVDAVEVVTADGEVVRADEEHEPDLLWLARGSGPGFPGIVTRFHLALHPLPAAATSSVLAFPIAEAPTVLEWVPQVDEQLPVEVEMCTFLGGSSLPGIGDMLGLTEPTVTIVASAFADTPEQAEEALAPLHACPFADRALATMLGIPTPFETLPGLTGGTLPAGQRTAADAQWSSVSTEEVVTDLLEVFGRAPSPKANINTVMLPDPGSGYPRPGAYSMDRRTVTLVYSMWEDPADDDANRAWVAETMRTIEHHATGRYLGEGDPRVAPGRIAACFDEESWARITELRRHYDPSGLFQDYLDETY